MTRVFALLAGLLLAGCVRAEVIEACQKMCAPRKAFVNALKCECEAPSASGEK